MVLAVWTSTMDGPKPPQAGPVGRLVLKAVGLLSVGLAFAGAVLPLLPTTPFVLLAAACFARSSPRFHAWLYDHPWFGPPLRSWKEHRAIPRSSRRAALALLWITFPISIVLIPAPLWGRAILAGILVIATIVVVRLPVLEDQAPTPEPDGTSTILGP